MIYRLDERLLFPDPALADDDGLLAIGGDLSVERLLLAYQNGIFPWFSEDDPILWYSPHERFVLYPHEITISKSMRKIMNSHTFEITVNQRFDEVVSNCSTINREGQTGTWITSGMKEAYSALHQLGYAHSVEIWKDSRLVGGLYGVNAGRVFCGESMFSLVSNASKAALIWLCLNTNYILIDCQVYTEHLQSMGARMINRDEYLNILHNKAPKL